MPSKSAIVVLVLAIAGSVAAAATPLPPRSDRLVYDTAGVIDDGAERELEQRHRELLAKARVALVVVTVPRLVDETIDELAVRLGQSWGVGRKGQDRGLVVALSRDDREIFVATGYGTEGYLPDGRVGALIDEHAAPYLGRGELSEGIRRLSNALAAESAREYGVALADSRTRTVEQRAPRPPGPLGIVLLVIVAVAFGLLAWRHPFLAMLLFASMGRARGGGGFGGGMGAGGFGGGGFGGGGAGRDF